MVAKRYRPLLFLTLTKYFGVGCINIESSLSQNFSFSSLTTVLKITVFEKFNFRMLVFSFDMSQKDFACPTDFSKELQSS